MNIIKLPAQVLSMTAFCAADSSRYAISGVQIVKSGDECTATATDGRQMFHLSWKADEGKDCKAVVPGYALAALRKCSGRCRRHFDPFMSIYRRGIVVGYVNEKERQPEFSIRTREPLGKFPNCQDVLASFRPANNPKRLDPRFMQNGLRLVTSFVDKDCPFSLFEFGEGDLCRLSGSMRWRHGNCQFQFVIATASKERQERGDA